MGIAFGAASDSLREAKGGAVTPCLSAHDACSRPKPCKYKQEWDEGKRSEEWLAERCEEMKAKEEGFEDVDN